MALIRVAQYNSTPTAITDYQAQNAHLQAFTNQLMTQQFILDSGTDQPVIKQGCYISHGGSLYIADADTAITGSPADGSVYIRVSGTTSLTVEFVTDISGYAWNPVYSALTSGSYTLLPYLIIKASSVWTRYNFNPNNQSFGDIRLNSLAVTGAISGATINTGYGDNEVFKTSYQTIEADATTAQLSAMDIGEVRYVYYSCRSYDDIARLKTPAGGNFYISPVEYLSGGSKKLLAGGSYAGNTVFVSSSGSGTVTGVFIIRRNS